MRRIVYSLLFVLIISLVAWYGLIPYLTKTQSNTTKKQIFPKLSSATLLAPAKPIIDFALIDTEEKPFNVASLKGKWTLMFFGYAQCPDICPMTLAIVSELWRSFPEQKPHPDAQLIFVSLDPASDTPPYYVIS